MLFYHLTVLMPVCTLRFVESQFTSNDLSDQKGQSEKLAETFSNFQKSVVVKQIFKGSTVSVFTICFPYKLGEEIVAITACTS